MWAGVWRRVLDALAVTAAIVAPVLTVTGAPVAANAVHAPDEEHNHNQVLLRPKGD